MKTSARTRMLTVTAMLSALAFILAMAIRTPIIPSAEFLKYDPKDVAILIGGFIFGPVPALTMSVVVSLIEMITVSTSGLIGFVMNAVSSAAFTCTASFIYKKKRTIKTAIIGLVMGVITATVVMLLWNYFLTPIYTGTPREAVVAILPTVILPFNLIKYGLNAALTMLVYKPVVKALRRTGIMPAEESQQKSGKLSVSALLFSAFVVISCALFIMSNQGII